MQVFDYSTSHKDVVDKVDVVRWEQFPAVDGFPFKVMWYCVPPSSNSPLDCHSEVELSIVLRGTATVQTDGSRKTVEQGNGFLLDSSQAHTVFNTSPDEPLLILSAYWMPLADGGAGDA